MQKDLLKYALSNLVHRKLRSSLTILSILIGIMAIFALLSFGQGLSAYVDTLSAEMGTDKIFIQPKSFGNPQASSVKFSEDDVHYIHDISGVKAVHGWEIESVKVEFKQKGKAKYAMIFGHPTDENIKLMEDALTWRITNGRQLKPGDVLKITAGYNYQIPDKIFHQPVKVGDKLLLNDIPVEVVGFYEEAGNPIDDMNLYISYEGLKALTGNDKNFSMIIAQAEKDQDSRALAKKIEEKFRKQRGEKKGQETFYAQTLEDLIESFGNILTGLKAVLVLIGMISVLVASVNIMNTMYTAVLERTKEIGVIKAVGARNSDVVQIFMIESGVLGFIGGVIGVCIGYLIAKLGGQIAANAGYASLQPSFPWWLVVGCIVFATLVGALSGLSPSIHASKQKPVDALRYE
ncbi:MAG: ABC transporter permease [Nanoarchaeota archaeon]